MSADVPSPRPKLTLERTYRAPIEDVWALWTTKEGIESWWGPEGFTVMVRSIALRAGGTMRYVMTATAPETVAFMKQAGMPITTEATITYTAVVPLRRLEYRLLADFIPGVPPYEVATHVALLPTAEGVRMIVEFDAMHDDVWTRRAVQGRESELRKLEVVIDRRLTG
jgi:uncharacterized protein YndB with AHSA1/START domain